MHPPKTEFHLRRGQLPHSKGDEVSIAVMEVCVLLFHPLYDH